MEYIRSLRTGIMEEYPVMSTSQGTCVRIEQTSEAIRVTYEICRAGGREDWNGIIEVVYMCQMVHTCCMDYFYNLVILRGSKMRFHYCFN